MTTFGNPNSMDSMVLHALIVDDHPIYREGLGLTLKNLPGYHVAIHYAPTLADANAFLDSQHPLDLIILDLKLPDGSGFSFLSQLIKRKLFVPSVILSASDDPLISKQAQQHGACGYLNKGEEPSLILKAISDILAGEFYFPEKVAYPYNTPLAPSITPRQQEVLKLLSRGMPNKRICQQLSISEHTIKTHLKALFHQLKVHNRTECVNKAQQLGLV